jgi:hypothetical protein
MRQDFQGSKQHGRNIMKNTKRTNGWLLAFAAMAALNVSVCTRACGTPEGFRFYVGGTALIAICTQNTVGWPLVAWCYVKTARGEKLAEAEPTAL